MSTDLGSVLLPSSLFCELGLCFQHHYLILISSAVSCTFTSLLPIHKFWIWSSSVFLFSQTWSRKIRFRVSTSSVLANWTDSTIMFINPDIWIWVILFSLSFYVIGNNLCFRQPNDGFKKFQQTGIAHSLEILSKPNIIKGCSYEHKIAQYSLQDFVMCFLNWYHFAKAKNLWQTKRG